jgi:hypothetical protein
LAQKIRQRWSQDFGPVAKLWRLTSAETRSGSTSPRKAVEGSAKSRACNAVRMVSRGLGIDGLRVVWDPKVLSIAVRYRTLQLRQLSWHVGSAVQEINYDHLIRSRDKYDEMLAAARKMQILGQVRIDQAAAILRQGCTGRDVTACRNQILFKSIGLSRSEGLDRPAPGPAALAA